MFQIFIILRMPKMFFIENAARMVWINPWNTKNEDKTLR